MEIRTPDIPTSLEPAAELDQLGDEIAELSAHLDAARGPGRSPRRYGGRSTMPRRAAITAASLSPTSSRSASSCAA